MDYEFNLEGAITEYFEELGIEANVEVFFDYDDPDFETTEMTVSWEEDDDIQTFYLHNAQRFTAEQLYDLWVEDREERHEHYLEWLKTA